MLIRLVRMTFQEAHVAAFLVNFGRHKEKIRSFPGCHHLELWRDWNKKNCYMTFSLWESEHFLNNYRESELFRSVWNATKPLFSENPVAFSLKKMEEVEI